MSNIRNFSAAALILLLLSGCVSVSSKHSSVNANDEDFTQRGVRYYLPQPFLMVTPSAEHAGVDVKPVMMPDYTRAYTIDSHTIMSKSGLTIETDNGLLKVVKASGDPSATAGAAIEAAGAVGVEMLKLEAAKSQLDAAKEEAREKYFWENLDELEKILASLPGKSRLYAIPFSEADYTLSIQGFDEFKTGTYVPKAVDNSAPVFNDDEKKLLSEFNQMNEKLRTLHQAKKWHVSEGLIGAAEIADLQPYADILNKLYIDLYARKLKDNPKAAAADIAKIGRVIQTGEARLLQGMRLRPQLVMVDTSKEGVHLVPVELRTNKGKVRDPHHEHQILRTLPTPPKGDPKPDNYQRIDIHLPDLKNGIKAEIPEK